MPNILIERNKITSSDIATGFGTLEQVRGGLTVTKTLVNAHNIPHTADISIGDKIDELDNNITNLSDTLEKVLSYMSGLDTYPLKVNTQTLKSTTTPSNYPNSVDNSVDSNTVDLIARHLVLNNGTLEVFARRFNWSDATHNYRLFAVYTEHSLFYLAPPPDQILAVFRQDSTLNDEFIRLS